MRLYQISLVSVAIMLLFMACSQQHIRPDPAEMMTNAMQNEWEQQTGVPLFDGMGEHHHAVSTNHPGAQRYFNQGLVLSYAYNHAESARAFRAAQILDDRCAMCFWGEALALGPNINVTYQGQVVMDDESRIQAFATIQRAIALKAEVSERERDYIDALSARYNGDVTSERAPLDLAYSEAMRHLVEKYPEDDDAAALYAEAMMNLMPWDYWIDPDTPRELTTEVIDVLERVLERSPRHPLGIHLYIHAVESSSSPERAEPWADILVDLVPGAGHLVHMPSHTYWRVGRYHDAALANAKAVAVDEAYIAACNAQGFYPAAYLPHNLHFLWAAYSMEGRSQAALAAARKVADSVPDAMVAEFPIIEFYKTVPMLTLSDFGRWQAILDEPQPPKSRAYSNAIWHYARALAHVRQNNFAAAQTEHQQLRTVLADERIKALDAMDYPASQILEIAEKLIAGELLMAQDQNNNAIAAFEAAVVIQDALPYMEPPYWHYPVRHTLGKALMASGDFSAAETVYRNNLNNYPHNGWGLFGLMQSLEAQERPSAEVEAAFQRAWQRADVSLTSSRF